MPQVMTKRCTAVNPRTGHRCTEGLYHEDEHIFAPLGKITKRSERWHSKPKKWNGLCPAGKHGLDYFGQDCDFCANNAKAIRPFPEAVPGSFDAIYQKLNESNWPQARLLEAYTAEYAAGLTLRTAHAKVSNPEMLELAKREMAEQISYWLKTPGAPTPQQVLNNPHVAVAWAVARFMQGKEWQK